MPTDEEMQALLRELRGVGGIGHGVESLEAFLLFPDTFRREYIQLCARALRGALEGSDGQAKAGEVGLAKRRASTARAEKGVVGGVQSGGKRYRRHWTVRDENALDVKNWVDRRLRALARDITTMLEVRSGNLEVSGGGATSTRCAGCSRFVQRAWNYCPTCGAALRVDVGGEG